MFPNRSNSCSKTNNGVCYVIKKKQGVYYTILDCWNRGFYATPDPKRFKNESDALTFKQENNLDGTIVKGWLDESSGFYEGEFCGL